MRFILTIYIYIYIIYIAHLGNWTEIPIVLCAEREKTHL